ncbi:cob(I)yrinic acid a,c-diamide adenosyltransferase [Erythrobacter sp. HI00D59]|uniref:cob(I)yrinic acid a,c-diamide adenosyltransferase n=1 Tax=Qipengyuania flava TaxID=192812 RepID=UPI0007C3D4C4|nr:cob(I)yrinic acid a,c-diamide adenosyltransferase [Qipengyuania flava]ASP31328.1 cob(I)yrinic acid a,c-diamide adenosyltransferase [Qipengyuania flava]KZX52831.1 cob(I)yrinic acid a,c-diamide adenosyltransferase [Erythrobacter sp. HI00D59]
MSDTNSETHAARMKELQAAQAKRRRELKEPDRGLVLVHTGDGKGKSSSAFGVIARALGWGQKVAVVQFIKGKWKTGEKQFFARFPDLVDWHVMGDGFTWDTQDKERDIEAAEKALAKAGELIASGDYALIVLDEINIALRYDYLTPQAVIDALERRGDTRVILTGRDAKPELIDYADTVTEMTETKHAYHAGIRAQQGIDF